MEGYKLLEFIGRGAYGEVYKGIRTRDSLVVAVKKNILVVNNELSEGIPATTIREISLLKELDHPNIIGLLQADLTDAGRIWIIMVSGDGSGRRLGPETRHAARHPHSAAAQC